MLIELQTIPGCPHGASALALFAEALTLEGLDPNAIRVREISTDTEARAVSFHGSPSFTIGAADLFPSAAEPAVACRVYPGPAGLAGQPGLESLRQAIRAATAKVP